MQNGISDNSFSNSLGTVFRLTPHLHAIHLSNINIFHLYNMIKIRIDSRVLWQCILLIRQSNRNSFISFYNQFLPQRTN